jgi:catechol 2,3-dioxygenase-like lactoylglutathione lyase family enzyme
MLLRHRPPSISKLDRRSGRHRYRFSSEVVSGSCDGLERKRGRFFKATSAARSYATGMDIQFIASIAVITPDPPKSRELFIDALGLPLEASPGSDYFHSERVRGSKHFGVWPLSQAAQACFGTPDWPADRTVPQMSLEFEVRDGAAVQSAAEELRQRGFALLHDRREEPWGQTVARLQSEEGAIIGISFAPSLHD